MSTKQEEQAAQDFGLSDSLPEGWEPSEGSTVIGEVLALTKGWSDYQKTFYPIVVVHDELTNKDIAIHCFHYALQDRMTSLRPQVGERIGIKMGPKVALKRDPKQSVQTYTVKIEGRTEDIWGDIKPPRESTQSELPDVQTTDDSDIPF